MLAACTHSYQGHTVEINNSYSSSHVANKQKWNQEAAVIFYLSPKAKLYKCMWFVPHENCSCRNLQKEKTAVICFSCSYGACDKYRPGASGNNKLHQAGWASVKCCEEDGGTCQQPGHHFQRETPCQSHGALLTRVRSRARPPQQETQSQSSPCFIGLCLSQIYLWMFSCSEGLNKPMMTIWNLYQSANPIL